MSIDNEENKLDENKPNTSGKAFNNGEAAKLSGLQQKLFEGIEKTKEVASATPRKVKNTKNKTPSSSVKKPSNRKRKRKKDSDGSTEDSDFNSDFDDDS